VERRAHVRYEVRLPGQIIWRHGAERRRCTIVDISLEGARIDTGFFVDVPKAIFLFETNAAHLFECEVRWQQGSNLGLFFVDSGSLAARRSLIRQGSCTHRSSGPTGS
jgi:hypothetical protein